MKILDVTHISTRGSSYGVTLPKKVIDKLNLEPDDIPIYLEKDGEVIEEG